MIKDSMIHFMKKNYMWVSFFKALTLFLLAMFIFFIVGIVGSILVYLEVSANFVIVCLVALSSFMYTIIKPISIDVENYFDAKMYHKVKIHGIKVKVEKCNDKVSELVMKGYIIEKVSSMGAQDVLITYYAPMSVEEETKRVEALNDFAKKKKKK